MKVNRYEGLAIAIALIVFGRVLVTVVRMLLGAAQ